jgi:hypothetical protein
MFRWFKRDPLKYERLEALCQINAKIERYKRRLFELNRKGDGSIDLAFMLRDALHEARSQKIRLEQLLKEIDE